MNDFGFTPFDTYYALQAGVHHLNTTIINYTSICYIINVILLFMFAHILHKSHLFFSLL